MQDCLNNICFYGASITKQPQGFGYFFKHLNADKNVYSIAYGGTRIMDAGICHINKIIESSPDYCFIDWFSAQMPIAPSWEYLEKCIDTIVIKLLEIDCLPIFLFFFRMDSQTLRTIHPKRLELYNFIKDYCEKYNIDYIELFNDKDVLSLHEQNKLIADMAHTLPYGAKKYAEIIDKKFNERIKYKDISKNIRPPKNELYDIKEYPLPVNISNSLKIYGRGRIIGINQYVGPHSGIINMSHANGKQDKFNCWDEYCFYQRNIISRIDTEFNDWLEIKVSQEEFDTSKIKKPVGIYTQEKMIKSISIFYIGEISSMEYLA